VAEVESPDPCPQYYIVEGAGDDDCNGWYVRERTGTDAKSTVFYNRSSPSGRVYTLSSQRGGWYIARLGPAAGAVTKIYRCQRTSSSGSFEHVLPPTIGWSPVVDKISPKPAASAQQKPQVIAIRLDGADDHVSGDDHNGVPPQQPQPLLPLPPDLTDGQASAAFPELAGGGSPLSRRGQGGGGPGSGHSRKGTMANRLGNTLMPTLPSAGDGEDGEDPGRSAEGERTPPLRSSSGSWKTKLHMNKAKESITVSMHAVNLMKAHTGESHDALFHIPPRVRCLVAPAQLPLFLRLCASDVVSTGEYPSGVRQYHFHLHGETAKKASPAGREDFLAAAIRNCTGCGDVSNLVQMRIDHCQHIALLSLATSVRTILYLIFCSNTGMLEEELAELGMFPGGAKTLEWEFVFGTVRPLLVCHAGRWNFMHPEIREGVNQLFTSPMVEWAYVSTAYSFFATSKERGGGAGGGWGGGAAAVLDDGDDDGGDFEAALLGRSLLRQQRAAEELENRERFPAGIFRAELKANGLKFEEVKLIGWAMQYNCTLTSLLLAQNRMGNRGAKLIAQGLQRNTKLHRLDLADNSIGIEGAAELAKSLVVNQRLANLDLSKNRIKVRARCCF
jgi:hypothetical protein